MMSQCRIHPKREGVFPCQKHQIAYCRQCFEQGVSCTDPKLYCKFRPQCLIHESEKERQEEEKNEGVQCSKFKVQDYGQ